MLKNYHCAVFHNRVILNGKYEALETIAIGYHTYNRSTLGRNLLFYEREERASSGKGDGEVTFVGDP